MGEPRLSVENLTVERGGRTVLSHLSFTLDAGEVLLVSGRNGAGKSTLLRTVCGLLSAQAGRIRFGLANDEVRGVETVHYLGYEDALKPSLTVRENLEFWAAMLAVPLPLAAREDLAVGENHGSRSTITVSKALSALGIARLIDLPAAYLSAGQKRRVALARLFVTTRPLWILDEPFIALDTAAQTALVDIMAAHVAARGAILFASHQPLPLSCREIDLDTQATA